MTPADVTELIAVLVAAYPGSRVGQRTVDVYRHMLADLDFEAAKQAVHQLVSTSDFFPSVAKIKAAAVDVESGTRPLALEAWGAVCAEIQRTGHWGKPRLKDPVAKRCVQILGWKELCKSENDAADRARFCELYNGLQDRGRQEAMVGALPLGEAVARLKGSGEGNV